jgi:uncharacterized phage-associated protein
MTFNQVKTAQAAAWILSTCGNPMEIMKLVKLLYLSDRASFAKTGQSLTGDRMVSMPYGPVLSTTYTVMNGEGPRVPGGWDCWVSDRVGHRVALHEHCNAVREKLTELSDADIELINGVCAEFGRLGSWELSDYTHKHCPEWEDPHGSSYPISYKRLFNALGKTDEDAEALAEYARADDEIDLLFSRL